MDLIKFVTQFGSTVSTDSVKFSILIYDSISKMLRAENKNPKASRGARFDEFLFDKKLPIVKKTTIEMEEACY